MKVMPSMQIYHQIRSWFLQDKYIFICICIDFLFKFAPCFYKHRNDVYFES